jgi:hypothetical protein
MFTLLGGVTFFMSDALTGFTIKMDNNFEITYLDGMPTKEDTAYLICDVKNIGNFADDAVIKAGIWDESMDIEYYYKIIRINPGETKKVAFKFPLINSKIEYSPERVICSVE